MAEVFVSYKREDGERVRWLVQGLRAAGLNVWWDEDIAPDAPWEGTIEAALTAAKAVIVAWSRAAVGSENVKSEARVARTAGKLIQVFAPCIPPLFFGERQGVDLSGWGGAPQDRGFQTVLAAVRAVIAGEKPPHGVGHAPKRRSEPGAMNRWARWAARRPVLVTVLSGLIPGVLGVMALIEDVNTLKVPVCALAPLQQPCRAFGLIGPPPPDGASLAAAARAALLAKVPGVWGPPACATTLVYTVRRRGEDDIVMLRAAPYESEGRVASAEGGSIFTRTISPPAEAGAQWELRLEGDRLIQVDSRNVATPLVRCDG